MSRSRSTSWCWSCFYTSALRTTRTILSNFFQLSFNPVGFYFAGYCGACNRIIPTFNSLVIIFLSNVLVQRHFITSPIFTIHTQTSESTLIADPNILQNSPRLVKFIYI